MSELASRFDVVIVDAAPVLPVADGAIVAAAADGAVLIVRYGKTSRDQVHKAAESLEHVDARLLGVALNFAPSKKRGYGYKQGYGYGGYGYSSKKKADQKPSRAEKKAAKKSAGSESNVKTDAGLDVLHGK